MGQKSIRREVADASGTHLKDWTYIDGPDSGLGVDFHLRHISGAEAYVNRDQGHLTISISKDGE